MPIFTVKNLAQYGVISDVAPFEAPPNAWTSARNVTFDNRGVSKSGNRVGVMPNAVARVNKTYCKPSHMYYTTSDRIYLANSFTNTDISAGGNAYVGATEWYITELSGILVFTSDSNDPQMLLNNATQAAKLTGWGSEGGTKSWRTPKIRAFKNFLIAIGMTEEGVAYPQRIRWSDLAVPNQPPPSWDATSTTNSAGFNDLSEARGTLMDGLAMGDYFVLYTTQEVYLVSYVAGNDIFSFRKIFDDLSILAPECACAVNGGHFVVTTSDVVIHNGSTYQSVINDRIKNELFSVIRAGNPEKVKVQYYPAKNEVWVVYPSLKGAELDRTAIYNLNNGTWTFRELPGITAIGYGVVPSDLDRIIDSQHQVFDSDSQLIAGIGQDFIRGSLYTVTADLTWWAMDEGGAGEVNMPCSFVKQSMDFDDWGIEATQHKQVKAVYPQFSGSGTIYISLGVAETPFDSPVWTQAVPFNIGVDRKADFRVTGRYISVKFESVGEEQWSLLSYSIEGAARGNR